MKRVLILIVMLNVCLCSFGASIHFGRSFLDEDKDFLFQFNYGSLTELEGRVVETKRASQDYDYKRHEYEKYLEDYTFDELGFEDSYPLWGLSLEKQWKFLTVQLQGAYFNADTSSVAQNEPFAIGVEEVFFDGKEYSYMLIPEGAEFDTEIDGAVLALGLQITPFHLNLAEKIHVTPWIHLGIYSISGKFKIDAGEPLGITHYEYHDYDYVIQGKGEGWFGAGFPEYGFGGEIQVELGAAETKPFLLIVQGNLVSVNWEGSTDDFGLNIRHEKDIDLDYDRAQFRVSLEVPVFESSIFFVGFEMTEMDAFIKVEAKERTEEEVELLKEKYDKDISLDVSTFWLFGGFRF